jgi:hypothetical protein
MLRNCKQYFQHCKYLHLEYGEAEVDNILEEHYGVAAESRYHYCEYKLDGQLAEDELDYQSAEGEHIELRWTHH